jgi:predicted lipoprotein with Yx(FWY)xxD motif
MQYPPTPADISMIEEGGKLLLRTAEGMSMYRYDADTDGKPHCLADCNKEWPPVIASKDAHPVGDWTITTRPDGARQWCYRRQPVYTHSLDLPGRSDGDGKGGMWHVVKL